MLLTRLANVAPLVTANRNHRVRCSRSGDSGALLWNSAPIAVSTVLAADESQIAPSRSAAGGWS
jgi:hypothetical protein